MIKEYNYWMRERSIKVVHKGSRYFLNNYQSTNIQPRPESYYEVNVLRKYSNLLNFNVYIYI